MSQSAYTEENGILGGGYLNKTDEEEAEESEETKDSESIGEDSEDAGDNFDTDDTVFYEEPEADTTQESTQEDE